MTTKTFPAEVDRLDEVNAFIDEALEPYACSPKAQMEIALAVEEIFVNIANYAYTPRKGQAEIVVDVWGDPPMLTVGFLDWGKPFNPQSDGRCELCPRGREKYPHHPQTDLLTYIIPGGPPFPGFPPTWMTDSVFI